MNASAEDSPSKLRIGVVVPGLHKAAFGEGLLQYLIFLIRGLTPGVAQLNLAMRAESVEAFMTWRSHMPADLQADIVITGVSHTILTDLWPTPVSDEQRNWVRSFEAGIDVWFPIQPHYTILESALKPVVALFADFVFAEYPTLFPDELFPKNQLPEHVHEATMKMVPSTAGYICFSEHVKRRQILRHFDIPEDRIFVIPHAPFDYRAIAGANFEGREAAAERIREYLRDEPLKWRDAWQERLLGETLKEFPFEHAPYVFVSTRARPHKNVEIIVRAALALRRRYSNVKFIVTAPMRWDNPQDEFTRQVIAHGLHWDIVSVSHTPTTIHAALYACAALTLHPSPFEGGFPFTAFEALSMNCPVLLADGAVARETLPRGSEDLFLFSPISPKGLAERIESVIDARDEILQRQQEALGGLGGSLRGNVEKVLQIMRSAIETGPIGLDLATSDAVVYDAAAPVDLEGLGWHRGESWGRWASEREAALVYWNPRSNASGALEIRLNAPPRHPGEVYKGAIKVQGEIAANFVVDGSAGYKISVRIENIPAGRIELGIVSDVLRSPSSVDPKSSDPRELGLGIVSVRPAES